MSVFVLWINENNILIWGVFWGRGCCNNGCPPVTCLDHFDFSTLVQPVRRYYRDSKHVWVSKKYNARVSFAFALPGHHHFFWRIFWGVVSQSKLAIFVPSKGPELVSKEKFKWESTVCPKLFGLFTWSQSGSKELVETSIVPSDT